MLDVRGSAWQKPYQPPLRQILQCRHTDLPISSPVCSGLQTRVTCMYDHYRQHRGNAYSTTAYVCMYLYCVNRTNKMFPAIKDELIEVLNK